MSFVILNWAWGPDNIRGLGPGSSLNWGGLSLLEIMSSRLNFIGVCSIFMTHTACGNNISTFSLCWWFQYQNDILSKSLANLDFTEEHSHFRLYLRERSCYFSYESCQLSGAKPWEDFSQLALIVLKLFSEQLRADSASHLRNQTEEESRGLYIFVFIFPLLTVCSVWALTLADHGVIEPAEDVILGRDVIFNLCQDSWNLTPGESFFRDSLQVFHVKV